MSRQAENSQKKQSKRAGQVLESKGGKLYVKFDKDMEIKEGDVMFLTDYEEHLQFLVDKGYKTEEEAGELFAKTGFVKYIVNPPKQD